MSNDDSMVDKAKNKAEDVWDKTKDKADDAWDATKDAGNRAKDKVEEIGNKPKEGSFMDKVSDKIEDLIPGDSDGDGH